MSGSKGETTAQAIRDCSRSLIARHGYGAVSMRMIADAVGVNAGALYQYHATKQQLLVTLMREHMVDLLAAWCDEYQSDETPIKALERFVRFHIRYNITRPDDVFIAYMELRALEPEGFALIEKLRKEYEGALKSIIAKGMAEGSFSCEDAHVSAMAILAMLTGINTWFRSGGRLSENKIEHLYVGMILRSVGSALGGQNNV